MAEKKTRKPRTKKADKKEIVPVLSEEEKEIQRKKNITDAVSTYIMGHGTAEKLSDFQKELFLETAKAFDLNPLKREIHAVPYEVWEYDKQKGKKVPTGKYDMSIVTGYEVYLKRAERSGLHQGYKVTTERLMTPAIDQDGNIKTNSQGGIIKTIDIKACVWVYRRGFQEPFYHEVYWSEYKQNNNMWKTKGQTMIKKVAICQAFRLCYPDEFGGMPYAPEEIDMGTIGADKVIGVPDKSVQLVEYDAEKQNNTAQNLIAKLKWTGNEFPDLVEGMFNLTWDELSSDQKEQVLNKMKEKADAEKKKTKV